MSIQEFSSLMLDISNMLEEDKLFNFMFGLQPWAQAELRRQGIKDVQVAMAAADSLVDFKYASSSSTNPKKAPDSKKGKVIASRGWKKFDKAKRDDGNKPSSSQPPKHKGCYICMSSHLASFCPKKERVNALMAEEENGAAVQVDCLRTSHHYNFSMQ